MSKRRVLTQEQINIAYKLKNIGYSNRQIANFLEVPKTTIWVNVYKRKENLTPTLYRKINLVVYAIQTRKKEGKTSLETAQELHLPLEEVNYIWSNLIIKV